MIAGTRWPVNPRRRVSVAAQKSNSPFVGFKGYTKPGYTQVPDEFLDLQVPYLAPAEVVLMVVFFRLTLGWKKETDSVSIKQLVKRTGLSEATICRWLPKLEAKGLIEVARTQTSAGDPAPNQYTVRWLSQREGASVQREGAAPSRGRTGPSNVKAHKRERAKRHLDDGQQPRRLSGQHDHEDGQRLAALLGSVEIPAGSKSPELGPASPESEAEEL
jgi:hypothetical protein